MDTYYVLAIKKTYQLVKNHITYAIWNSEDCCSIIYFKQIHGPNKIEIVVYKKFLENKDVSEICVGGKKRIICIDYD